jgi:hypothetical protein
LADLEGDELLTVALDVTQKDQIAPAPDATMKRCGRI